MLFRSESSLGSLPPWPLDCPWSKAASVHLTPGAGERLARLLSACISSAHPRAGRVSGPCWAEADLGHSPPHAVGDSERDQWPSVLLWGPCVCSGLCSGECLYPKHTLDKHHQEKGRNRQLHGQEDTQVPGLSRWDPTDGCLERTSTPVHH